MFVYIVVLFVALIIGILGGFIGGAILRAQLFSVHKQQAAQNYVIDNGLHLQEHKDRFLYATTTQSAKPQTHQQSN